MNFYQLMQLDPMQMKPMIKNETDKKIKNKYIGAFITKNLLCTLFCLAVVGGFMSIFGQDNSMPGAVIVILVLSFRTTNLDFKVNQSVFGIMGIYLILALFPFLANSVNPFLGLIINTIGVLALLVFGCSNVMYGNHIILTLCYFLIYGNPVASPNGFKLRFIGLMLGGVVTALIFYTKHKKANKDYENTFGDIARAFKLTNPKSIYQLRIALGMCGGVFFGELIGLQKTMWIAFACFSIVYQPTKERMNKRCKRRLIFVTLGATIFAITYLIVPESLRGLIPIAAGFAMGFCITYESQAITTNFTSIPLAIGSMGLASAVGYRIINNIFSIIYSKIFDVVFNKAINKISNKNEKVEAAA